MRTLLVSSVVVFVSLSAVACGGGGGGAGGGAASSVAGTIVAKDGSSADLGGVTLRLVGSFEAVAVSDAAGRFDFGDVPSGAWQLVVGPRSSAGGIEGDDDEGDDDEGDDDEGDDEGEEGDDDEEDEVEGVEIEGDEVEIKLVLEDGVIVKIEVSSDGGLEAKVVLARSDASDDADVEGTAKLEVDDEGEELKVEADHLDVGRTVEAFLVREDTETSLGVRTADEDGEAEWAFEDGDLPLDVASVEDLEGLRVEVRDATTGTVLLYGEVPELPAPLPDGDDDGDDGDDGDDDGEDEAEFHALLTPAEGVQGRAVVEVEREDEDGAVESELEVELEDLALAPGTAIVVLLEDPEDPGVLVVIATLTVDEEGDAEVEFESDEGGLPFGVSSVAELAGLAIEVRVQATDELLFSGTVPSLP